MSSRPPDLMPGIFGRAFLGGRFDLLRRLSRWFNLTIIQQAVWPLLVMIFAAPQVDVENTPGNWFLARLAAPLAAAVLALLYLRRAARRSLDMTSLTRLDVPRAPGELARQARWLVLGLPVMVAVARLIAGPADEAVKIMLIGLAEVAAYHLINFWVVPASFPAGANGLNIGTITFAVSWGLHDLLLVGANDEGSLLLAFLAGVTVGLMVAVVSRLVRRWPGGTFTAPAFHWLLIYLVFGFV